MTSHCWFCGVTWRTPMPICQVCGHQTEERYAPESMERQMEVAIPDIGTVPPHQAFSPTENDQQKTPRCVLRRWRHANTSRVSAPSVSSKAAQSAP
jgi:hypothetical protein